MTERGPLSQRLSERDVEETLQRFFASEVPTEYRSEEPARQTASLAVAVDQMPQSSASSRQLAGLMAVVVSTLCCLFVVVLTPETDMGAPASETVTDGSASPATNTESYIPLEERDHLSFSSMGDAEEDNPAGENDPLSAPIPELEVEIFPE